MIAVGEIQTRREGRSGLVVADRIGDELVLVEAQIQTILRRPATQIAREHQLAGTVVLAESNLAKPAAKPEPGLVDVAGRCTDTIFTGALHLPTATDLDAVVELGIGLEVNFAVLICSEPTRVAAAN